MVFLGTCKFSLKRPENQDCSIKRNVCVRFEKKIENVKLLTIFDLK